MLKVTKALFMNHRDRARQIYLARMSPTLQRQAQEKKDSPASTAPLNQYMRFHALVESIGEALDVATAQAWLNRAYQTVLNRSTQIPSLSEKEAYSKLANVIQAAIPISSATEEDVEQNLALLRQQIIIGEGDSEVLRKLKSHLITSLSEVLSPTQKESPEEEQAGAPGEMPPPGGGGGEMGGPPPAGGPGGPPGGGPPGEMPL